MLKKRSRLLSSALALLVIATTIGGFLLVTHNTGAFASNAPQKKILSADGIRAHAKPLGQVNPNRQITSCPFGGGIRCFTPKQLQQAYNILPLQNKGITGKGTSIVIIDDCQAPTLQHDLLLYDKVFGIKDTTLNILTPLGTPKCATTDATETTLDVELAHAVAPGATINLVLTPSLSNQDIAAAFQFVAANNKLGDILSVSLGEDEKVDQ